jgi:hypothetical protein
MPSKRVMDNETKSFDVSENGCGAIDKSRVEFSGKMNLFFVA